MNKRIIQVGLLVLASVGMAGCDGTSSDEFEEDIQRLDSPINNEDPDRFRGRVMNGELENALVWLDRNEDGEFDSNEPAALSDADGRFELDISVFQRDRTEDDIDPGQFPLMAVAIPGFTENAQTGPVNKAFFLMAPPDIELITPFPTMAEAWRRLGDRSDGASGTEITERISGAEENIGVFSDFLVSGADRVPFYARALRRMIQAQVSDSLSDALASSAPVESAGELEGTAFALNDVRVIGSILVDQAGPILSEVDEAIQMNGGVDGFQLPDLESVTDVGADLDNPWLLRGQRVFLPEDGENGLDSADVPESARLAGIATHDYSLGTTLSRVTFRGVPDPSMESIVRIANEGGRVRELGAQPGLDFQLDNPVEGSVSTSDAPDERFIFDWNPEGDLARLQSPRIGALGLGSLSDYSEEDGDRIYRATEEQDGRITRMARVDPGNGASDYRIEESGFAANIERRVFDFLESGDRKRSVGPFTHCRDEVDGGFNAANDRVINAKQEIEVTDTNGQLLGTETYYGHLRAEDETGPRFRILVRDFVAASGDDNDNRRWEIEYYDDANNGELLSGEQPDLIRSMRLLEGESPFGGFCREDERRLAGARVDAFVMFEHILFTEFLEAFGTVN